jgi:hypothetical protein
LPPSLALPPCVVGTFTTSSRARGARRVRADFRSHILPCIDPPQVRRADESRGLPCRRQYALEASTRCVPAATPRPGPQAVDPDQDPMQTTIPVLLASAARRQYGTDARVAIDADHERDQKYQPPNLTAYLKQHEDPDRDESVAALPNASVAPLGLKPERAQAGVPRNRRLAVTV